MQDIDFRRKKIKSTIFFDIGANVSLILHDLAESLGLKGKRCRILIHTAMSEEPEWHSTKSYALKLVDNKGIKRKLILIGTDKITSRPQEVDVSACYRLFPFVRPGDLDRPTQEVGILLGVDHAEILTYGGDAEQGHRVDGLMCLRSHFGSGWVLAGKHESINHAEVEFTNECQKLRQASLVKMEHVEPRVVNHFMREQIDKQEGYFFEELGTEPPASCSKCIGCKDCADLNTDRSRQDREIYMQIRKQMRVDPVTKKIHTSYPLNDNYDDLVNNFSQAVQLEKSVEKTLKKLGLEDTYNIAFQEIVDRGAIVKVSWKEIEDWLAAGGRIHFIGHHGVFKEASLSTPLRIVNNAALRNNRTGPSLNQCSFKGGDHMRSMFRILLRWRTGLHCLTFDLSKAYNSIITGETEKYLRLQVWRFCDETRSWEIYGYTCVAFGDLIASLILEAAKDLCADMAEEAGMDPVAVQILRESVYVDDGMDITDDEEELKRLVGDCIVEEDGKLTFTGTISQVLATTAFKPKTIVTNGSGNHPEALKKQGKVLGLDWRPETDTIHYKFEFKIKESRRSVTSIVLSPDMLDKLDLTKRSCLGLSCQTFDPLGHLSPITIKLKIMMRDIVNLGESWDKTIPEELQVLWRNTIKKLMEMDEIVLPRTHKQVGCEAITELFCLFDGSMIAYCSVIWERWILASGFIAGIVAAKSRIVPAKGTTVPRSELSGYTQLSRQVVSKVDSMRIKPARITIAGDSECTISSIDAKTNVLAPFFQNRIVEAEENLAKCGTPIPEDIPVTQELPDHLRTAGKTWIDKVHHIEGKINTSDLGTRGECEQHQLAQGSEWQLGPPFLSQNRSTWPLTRDFIPAIPDEEKKSRAFKFINIITEEDKITLDPILKLVKRAPTLRQLRGSLARLFMLAAVHNDSKQGPAHTDIWATLSIPPTGTAFKKADHLIWRLTALDTEPHMEKGTLKTLMPYVREDTIMTQGRIGEAGRRMLGKDELPVVMADTDIARLVMKQCHEEDHRQSAADALYRSRKHCWIVGGKSLSKRVARECAKCKIWHNTVMEQKMGDIPPQMFQHHCPPWTNICIDFMGPRIVRSMTNKRARLRCYPLIIVCLNTGAIATQLVPAYDTSSFLIALRQHFAVRGKASFIYCDSGSNLTAAKKSTSSTRELVKTDIDWKRIIQETAADNMVWRIAPSGTQWRNGRAERAMGSLKHTLHFLISEDKMLNYQEAGCLLDMAADRVNERILGVSMTNGEEPEFSPITPNTLIKNSRTGQPLSDQDIDPDNDHKYHQRLSYMDTLFVQWWHKFYVDSFDQLFKYPKWYKETDNLKPGDVCLLKTVPKVGKPEYRLCRVSETYPDSSGVVRTVKIYMRPRDSREKSLPYRAKGMLTMDMSVQRLVLLYRHNADSVPATLATLQAVPGWQYSQ